jgi:hypothetical protein
MWTKHELKNNMILEDILFNFGHSLENQLSDHESMQMWNQTWEPMRALFKGELIISTLIRDQQLFEKYPDIF